MSEKLIEEFIDFIQIKNLKGEDRNKLVQHLIKKGKTTNKLLQKLKEEDFDDTIKGNLKNPILRKVFSFPYPSIFSFY